MRTLIRLEYTSVVSYADMAERLESIEKAVESLQSVNKDLIHLLEAMQQECHDLRALLNSSKVHN